MVISPCCCPWWALILSHHVLSQTLWCSLIWSQTCHSTKIQAEQPVTVLLDNPLCLSHYCPNRVLGCTVQFCLTFQLTSHCVCRCCVCSSFVVDGLDCVCDQGNLYNKWECLSVTFGWPKRDKGNVYVQDCSPKWLLRIKCDIIEIFMFVTAWLVVFGAAVVGLSWSKVRSLSSSFFVKNPLWPIQINFSPSLWAISTLYRWKLNTKYRITALHVTQ